MFKKEKSGKTNTKPQIGGEVVLFFLFVCLIILIFVIALTFSSIKIQIINLQYSSQNARHINKDYKIVIKLCLLRKIPIIKLNITKTKLEKLSLKEKVKDMETKFIQDKNKFDKDVIKAIKNLNLQIENINLKIEIGTENASLTSIIVPIISTVIAIILRKKVKEYDNQIFIIKPVYINQNLINILVSGIFEMKMIHIINIIYVLNKKEGVKKNERTSNRRTYGYSYE